MPVTDASLSYALRVVALSAGALTAIVTPIDCNYYCLRCDGSQITEQTDSTPGSAHTNVIDAGVQFGCLDALSDPRVSVPRFRSNSIVQYVTATGNANLVGKFLR